MFAAIKVAIVQWFVGITSFKFANAQTDGAIDLIAQELIEKLSAQIKI